MSDNVRTLADHKPALEFRYDAAGNTLDLVVDGDTVRTWHGVYDGTARAASPATFRPIPAVHVAVALKRAPWWLCKAVLREFADSLGEAVITSARRHLVPIWPDAVGQPMRDDLDEGA